MVRAAGLLLVDTRQGRIGPARSSRTSATRLSAARSNISRPFSAVPLLASQRPHWGEAAPPVLAKMHPGRGRGQVHL